MNRSHVLIYSLLSTLLLVATQARADDVATTASLQAIADGEHRSAAHRARNRYRHPAETLAFFGIRDDMTVVEISPGGGGWYTEILAPFLRANGTLYAGNYDPDAEEKYYQRNSRVFSEKMAASPDLYDKVRITVFDPPKKLEPAPAGSADMVVTFRNFHNWMEDGDHEAALQGMHQVLKPGGILGVVQHRGNPGAEQDPQAESGYVRQDYLIRLVELAGFKLVASSEINANPKDTKDHPEGVWTLPPNFQLEDVDRDNYTAIGESDRMTLKFVKTE
ncbi:MAG: methyltransferase domain-containing protein [Gammaproteobacteria bacterium]|nr:methyltransferase domain-containing protein [Gammaproteobacteria bacterium]